MWWICESSTKQSEIRLDSDDASFSDSEGYLGSDHAPACLVSDSTADSYEKALIVDRIVLAKEATGMRRTILTLCLAFTALGLAIPQQCMAQANPPMTLWRFLGIPQARAKVNSQLFNRRGNAPRMETKPPLKPISDPANLEPDMPEPIKAAAKIKQAEDMAPQKKKAIKYLAKIGCGCYDKFGEVTDALVAAMDDCTEDVRLDAVQAIMTAASEDPCCNCGSKCCCNEKILKKLAELAYERGPDGCHLEPSERVRQAAVEALMTCCTTQEPIEVLEEENGGGGGDVEGADDPPPPPPEIDDSVTMQYAPLRSGATFGVPGQSVTPSSGQNRRQTFAPPPIQQPPVSESSQQAPALEAPAAQATDTDDSDRLALSAFIDTGITPKPGKTQKRTVPAQLVADRGTHAPPSGKTELVKGKPATAKEENSEDLPDVLPRRGQVTYVNLQEGFARVKFTSMGQLPEQTRIRAFHKFLLHTSEVGEYVVIAWNQGEAIIRKADGIGVGKLARGDTILVK